MSNHCKFIAAAICMAFAMHANANDNWLEQQRSISDGYSAANFDAGAEGRKRVNHSSDGSPSWLDKQIGMSDGYSPASEVAKPSYIGASFEVLEDDLLERGRRITDGSPE